MLESLPPGEFFSSNGKSPEDQLALIRDVKWRVATVMPAILRASPTLESHRLGELPPGTIVRIVDIVDLANGTRRARTPDGWLTFSTPDGEKKLRCVLPHPAGECVEPGAKAMKLLAEGSFYIATDKP